MIISVIASGSNGNACLIEEGNSKVLIEAGVSCIEIERRLASAKKSLLGLEAVIVSHAHIDHCQSAGVISRKYGVPVYMTDETYNGCCNKMGDFNFVKFNNNHKLVMDDLDIYPVKTSHDSPSSGFVINERFGIFTDTGTISEEIKMLTRKLKAVLIESNYDEEMLAKGSYPQFLKARIFSDHGHLSNLQASGFVQDCGHQLEQVLLGHLSANNNTPALVERTFQSVVKRKLKYAVLSRDCFSGCLVV